jgi:epsin
VDLLVGFGDDEVAPKTPEKTVHATGATGGNVMDSLDDFGDFEAAPSSVTSPTSTTSTSLPPTQIRQGQMQIPLQAQAQAQPQQQGGKPNIFDMLGQNGSVPGTGVNTGSMGHNRQLSGGIGMMSPPISTGMNMGGGMGMGMNKPMMMTPTTFVNTPQRSSSFAPNTTVGGMHSSTMQATSSQAQTAKTSSTIGSGTKSSGGGGFEDLWSMSLGASGGPKKPVVSASSGKSIQELEREKAQKGIWGVSTASTITGTGIGVNKTSNGGFGNVSGGGDDDNLLL